MCAKSLFRVKPSQCFIFNQIFVKSQKFTFFNTTYIYYVIFTSEFLTNLTTNSSYRPIIIIVLHWYLSNFMQQLTSRWICKFSWNCFSKFYLQYFMQIFENILQITYICQIAKSYPVHKKCQPQTYRGPTQPKILQKLCKRFIRTSPLLKTWRLYQN